MNSTPWSKPTRYLALGALLLFLGILFYTLRPMIGPLVIAALLAYLLEPIVQWLNRKIGLKRRGAVYIVYFFALAVLFTLPAVATPLLIAQMDTFEQQVVRLIDLLRIVFGNLRFFGFSPIQEISADSQSYFSGLFHPDQLFGALRAATENAVWVLVILITTYYLMQDADRLRNWLQGLFPKRYRQDMSRLHVDLSRVWGYFLRGQLLSMFFIGLFSGVAAALLGLPAALVLGVLATILAVIPSVGSSTMIAIASLVAVFARSNYLNLAPILYTLIVAGVFTAIHLFENYWLRPRILGQRLRLHPGLVLVAIIGALTLGGILEALLIVPVIRSADILGRYLWRRILGAEPWPEESPSA